MPIPEIEERFLSRRQQGERYSRSTKTIERWGTDPTLGYPAEIDINGRKFRKLSELVTWERQRAAIAAPKAAPEPAAKMGDAEPRPTIGHAVAFATAADGDGERKMAAVFPPARDDSGAESSSKNRPLAAIVEDKVDCRFAIENAELAAKVEKLQNEKRQLEIKCATVAPTLADALSVLIGRRETLINGEDAIPELLRDGDPGFGPADVLELVKWFGALGKHWAKFETEARRAAKSGVKSEMLKKFEEAIGHPYGVYGKKAAAQPAEPAPTAPEISPSETPLQGNDPGPLPECLRRETPTPASSRTSQR